MKNFIILLLFTLISTTVIFAQNEIGSISYGVKLGGVNSWIGPSEDYSNNFGGVNRQQTSKNRLSINGGAYAEYIYTDRLRFRGELLYTSKGLNISESEISTNAKSFTDYNYSLNYLEIPLLATYNFEHPNFTPYVVGGFSPSYMITNPKVFAKSVQQDGKGNIISERTKEESIDSDLYNNFDMGLVIGVGVVLPNGFGAELRYTTGLTAVSNSPGNPSNKYLGLTTFYRLK